MVPCTSVVDQYVIAGNAITLQESYTFVGGSGFGKKKLNLKFSFFIYHLILKIFIILINFIVYNIAEIYLFFFVKPLLNTQNSFNFF